jgi:hypothetical protein
MKPKPQERGQALILIVFAAVALFAFAALAIDGSRVFSDRRHAQNAADTSVLAAALAKVRAQDYAAAAQNRAVSNGFTNGVNSTVEVHLCDEAGLDPACEGLPTGANPAEYIQVVIRMVTPTTFARIIGINEVPTVVTAVARASGTSTTSTFNGDVAIFATKNGIYDQCFLLTGGGSVVTHDSGIMINCEGNEAVFLNGGSNLQMDNPGQVAGCNNPLHNVTLSPSIQCFVPPQTVNASTFASVPTTQPAPGCGPAVTSMSNPLTPGTYASLVITSPTTMSPGVYCFTGGLTLVSGATLSGSGGAVQMVFQDQGINVTANSTMDFSDLEIYSNNGGFTLTSAGSTVHADRLRYYSTGAGTVQVNGNAELNSSNAYFYLHQGDIIMNGNAIITLHGPPQGDTFGGLLVHKPYSNTVPLSLNGGSNINLTGTFMAPGSDIRYNGGNNFVLHSQIIGSTFSINGQAELEIFYDPTENYSPPNSPLIQLTK